MNKQNPIIAPDNCHFVHKEAYYEPAYVTQEKKRLWSRVWQIACREEELRETGAYVTYNIGDESVIVVRQADGSIGAFHNACQHRGRRLTNGCGITRRFACQFHGWQYGVDGKNCHVTQREDWHGQLDKKDIDLKPVKIGAWGGFVFVNLNPTCETLESYLGAIPEILNPFQLDKMRYGWRKWLVLPCNWKIAIEVFNEGYHGPNTHQQLVKWGQPYYVAQSYGKHSMFGAASEAGTLSGHAEQHTDDVPDLRLNLDAYYQYMKIGLASLMTDTIAEQAAKLKDVLPAGTPPDDVVGKLLEMTVQADAARGVIWPSIDGAQYQKAGVDWHIFPNVVLLPMATNCLGYRSRPNGDDPDTCIFEVFHMERFPKDPKLPDNLRNDDIRDKDFWNEIFRQDFAQMEDTQKGIKSSGFAGPQINPIQESAITNFHRVYNEHLAGK
jgi:nitrite reductase/ring-hydroxylating ferredoxin subunit